MKTSIFFVIFCLISTFSFSAVKVTLPKDVVMMTDYCHYKAINHHDEVLLHYREYGTNKYRDAIWFPSSGIEILDSCYVGWSGITNNRVVFMMGNMIRTHSSQQGTQEVDVKKLLQGDVLSVDITGVNSFGQVVGNYRTRETPYSYKSFVYNRGKVEGFILKDAKSLGYNIASTKLLAINENGTLLGLFEYGDKHPFKDKIYIKGSKYFLWDGSTHIIDTDPTSTSEINYSITNLGFHLNNMDEVAFTLCFCDEKEENELINTFKWSKYEGSKLIAENFQVSGFDDRGQIVGRGKRGKNWPTFFVNMKGEYVSLDEEIKKVYPTSELVNFPNLSSNGTVVQWCRIWGEDQFVIINVD